MAFFDSRSAFEVVVARAPRAGLHSIPIGTRLGVYSVEECAADPRVGVFFRAYSGPDGFADTMSNNFVKRPNLKGTPFEAAHFGTFHLVGDWERFHASDDWHERIRFL